MKASCLNCKKKDSYLCNYPFILLNLIILTICTTHKYFTCKDSKNIWILKSRCKILKLSQIIRNNLASVRN